MLLVSVDDITTFEECREFISKCHVPTHRKEKKDET